MRHISAAPHIPVRTAYASAARRLNWRAREQMDATAPAAPEASPRHRIGGAPSASSATPAVAYDPETNGVVEKFIQTFKEPERHGYRTPRQARDALRRAPWHDRRVHQPRVR